MIVRPPNPEIVSTTSMILKVKWCKTSNVGGMNITYYPAPMCQGYIKQSVCLSLPDLAFRRYYEPNIESLRRKQKMVLPSPLVWNIIMALLGCLTN